jgi:endonuclease/exonuclease/phosphatase family metal-dependent hydrolase
MIARWSAMLGRLRRWASRNEWTARLLGRSHSKGTEVEPGLVLVQIDGLSRRQFERALRRGRMPFLRRLVQRERYRLRSMYSGLPSTTPAVQGELFYGVRMAVPAFCFRDSETGALARMFDPLPAAKIERELVAQGQAPLLAGGSSYANIYSGGAAESHFCPATMDVEKALRSANPLRFAGLLAWHLPSVVRIATLALVETGLAIVDFLRGIIAGRDLWKELKFVPSRVAVTIVLRELVTIGAMADAARGLPVVHLNLLGYDEQAHRRGPSSAFAHWTLKGIDDAIARVWRAARRSARREYDVWIYSDHGQQRTIPYPEIHGRTVAEAVADTVTRELGASIAPVQGPRRAPASRARWLRPGGIAGWLAGGDSQSSTDLAPLAQVAAMGPLGHIYLANAPTPASLNRLAAALVRDAGIPLVMARTEPSTAVAWTSDGQFTLPCDAAEILGPRHPYLEEVAKDLVALCHHPRAGTLVISGWTRHGPPLSFPIENGAHAGPGPEETRAFALLPCDAPMVRSGKHRFRPADLRDGALHALGRAPLPEGAQSAHHRRAGKGTLRLVTYNVHSCRGLDGKLSPARIARVLAQCDADIIALQELDVRRVRSGSIDQAHRIAQLLEMEYHFHAALAIEEEQYGDAVLSRLPLRLVQAGRLPDAPKGRPKEPRGALWVAVEFKDRQLQVLNTHLGLGSRERLAQAEALLGDDWLENPACRGPLVLCGDLNARPRSMTYRRIAAKLRDAQSELEGHRSQSTWFSHYPLVRIDHVFVDERIKVVAAEVPRTSLARLASDHLPLIVEFRIE